MSDHDASPKEWTHAHSLRHGPQRWLSKLQRKQIKQQQAYIAAITASAAAAHPHFVPPPLISGGASSSSSSSRRRSSLEHVDAAISPHGDANVSTLTPSPIVDSHDDVAAVPAAIAEGELEDDASEEESAEEDAERSLQRSRAPPLRHSVAPTDVTHILPDGSFAFRDNFRRQSSAPLMTSSSDVDDSWAPSELHQCCCCPACEIAAAHQLAAQQYYMQSLQHVHSSIVSPAHPPLDRSATFSGGSAFSPHARAYSTHARAQSAQLLSPATHIAPSFNEAALRLHAASHAAPSAPAQASSAFTSPSAAPQRSSTSLQPDSKKSLLSSQTGVAQPVVAAAVAVADVPAAVSVVAAPASVAPIAPPAPVSPHTALLPRWFLIILAILRETDGRDKLAKCVQYGARTFAILLRQLPAAIWWIGFASKHLREGRFAPIGRAINILLSSDVPAAAAATATATAVAVAEPALQVASMASGSGTSGAVVAARSSFSAALRSSYLADTSVFRARLETNPLYNGALSRIAVLSAALSSGRRVIRLLKWTYTLPTWAKTFASWKAQVRASLEKDALQQAHEEEEEERRKKEEEEEEEKQQKQQQQQGGDATKERSDSTVSSASTNALQAASGSHSPSPSQGVPKFRFSHPHPPHLWRRLPWLSSVELLDLSIAVATDVSDDLEWLSKYRLFPSEWGYRCGRIAMCLWFSTVILDLLLTFRILRHYHYQQRQLQRQIDEAQMEFATVARQLNLRQQQRQDRDLRRAQRRQLQHSPLFKRSRHSNSERVSQSHSSADQPMSEPQPASAAHVGATSNLAASAVSDASWSVLLSDVGSAHTSSSGSEGSSTRSSQSQPAGDASDSRASSASGEQEHDDTDAPASAGHHAVAPADAEHKDDDDDDASHADDGADCVHSDDELESAEDAAAGELLQSSSVEAYRRVSELRSQAGAIRVSLFLQYLNFAKFTFDLGCAAPMAWNVQKEHDSMVQATGLVSGLLGVYKLFITAKPAQ